MMTGGGEGSLLRLPLGGTSNGARRLGRGKFGNIATIR